MFDEQSWEERYRSREAIWSGNPNPNLVAEAAGLTPGEALDVGCGEGADALWLAARGWRVTAVDFSTTALERAAVHAETFGPQVAARVEWVHADLTAGVLPDRRFDLVTSQYMHLPDGPRQALFAHLATLVAPGGTLLIVGHHPSDLQVVPRPDLPMFFTADEVAATLAPTEWKILTTDARPRSATHPDGHPVTIHDTVLVARRRP